MTSSGEDATLPEGDDPDDQVFLGLALAGDAEALVTGADDLLRLDDLTPFPILTSVQLKRRVS